MRHQTSNLTTSVSLIALSIISANSLMIATSAQAETRAPSAIIITGEKIDRDLRETTAAISVISEEKLLSNEVKQAREIATTAPNVVQDSFGNISIRGMSGGGAATGGAALITGSRARVATVVDGSTQDWSGYNFTPSTLWDVEQVEVLRGVQSTAQGASAIGGAIVIKTKDPSFTNEAAIRVGLDHFQNGNQKHNLAAMLSGPIIENELAYRVALDSSSGEGWLNYNNDDDSVPNLSHAQSINMRGKLLWEPANTPELSTKLTFNYHQNKGEHASFASNNDPDIDSQTLDLSSTISRVQDSNENSLALDVNYELGDGLMNYFHLSHIDSDIYADGYQTGKVHTYDIEQKSTALENRLVFDSQESKLTGVIGLFAAKKRSAIHANQNILIDTDYTTRTTAVYGQSSYALTDKTKITAGLRIENEDTDKLGSFFNSAKLRQDANQTYYLPKLELTHQLSATTLGASVRKGYSPSGSGITFGGDVYTYDSEQVTAYELSSKSLIGENTRINANIFYNEYQDYQALSGLSILNVDSANTYGAELELVTWPTANTQFSGSVGLLKTNIRSDASYQGKELSSAPRTNVSIGVNHFIGSHWSLGADVTYVGHFYSDLANTNDSKVGGHAIANTLIQYQHKDLTISGYIKNLANQDSLYYRSGALASVGQSRTLGISANYRL